MMHDLLKGAFLFCPLFVGYLFQGLAMRFNWLAGLAKPIDRGATFRGRRLLGDNKTYRGIAVVSMGAALGFAGFRPLPLPIGVAALAGFAFGAAAMLSELPNSFIKRQLAIQPGAQTAGAWGIVFHILDQVDVLVGGWLVLAFFVRPTLAMVAGSFLCVYVVHQIITAIGYRLGMRATAR